MKDEIEKNLDVSDITATDIKHEILGPNILEEYRKQVTKRMKGDEDLVILALYV